MSLSVKGALANWKLKDFRKMFKRDDGSYYTPQEAKEALIDELAQGHLSIPRELPRGGIVGVAEIYGCVKSYDSKWFFGPWGFLLRNQVPRPLMPLKGQRKFFEAEYRVAA